MRKFLRISTLAALALGATALTAQAQGAKQFGILAGVGFANMSASDDFDGFDLGTRTGFVGGFYFALPVAARMAIEPEVLYTMKGTKLNDFDIDLNNDYIEIPVLFKYNFNDAGGPYLLAGPSVGFSISCNESVRLGTRSAAKTTGSRPPRPSAACSDSASRRTDSASKGATTSTSATPSTRSPRRTTSGPFSPGS